MISFLDVYSNDEYFNIPKVLYEMLEDRLETPDVNISHTKMPTWADHCSFIASKPYALWFLIIDDSGPFVAGAVYLTDRREVGIHLRRPYRGKGYGRASIEMLTRLSPGPLYANINPRNEASIQFFAALGFSLAQNTYVKV